MLESLLTHLNETAQPVLHSLFTAKSFEAFLSECAGFLAAQPARLVADLASARLEANKRFENFSKLKAHATRSRSASVRAYMEALNKLEARFKTSPSNGLWEVLKKHSEHASSLLDELQVGGFADHLSVVVLEVLQEDLAKDAEALLKQIAKAKGGAEADEVSDEDIKVHDKFIKALEKEFEISVHHFEPINDGVFVFLDEENNDILLDKLKSLESILNDITDKHGYLLLRKGTPDDIVWGSYPNGMAKWMFIYCPQDSEQGGWGDSFKDMEDEVLSHAKELKNKEPKKTAKPGGDLKQESAGQRFRLTNSKGARATTVMARNSDDDQPCALCGHSYEAHEPDMQCHDGEAHGNRCACRAWKKPAKTHENMEKRFTKIVTNPETGRKRTVKYGQAGKAKDGKDRIRPGTAKGDAYCARSAKIKGDWASDPNSPNNLSRRKWKCKGSKSVK